MSTAAQLAVAAPVAGTLAPTGALVFATAAAALAQMRGTVERGEVDVLDLAGINAADSAGLAVVLALARIARSHGRALRIRAMPASLLALASLGDVNALLDLDPAPAQGTAGV